MKLCRYKLLKKGNRKIPEHRFVLEQHRGRSIPKRFVIHHRNQCKRDNRIENLAVMTHSTHMQLHAKLSKPSRICPICKLETGEFGVIRIEPALKQKLVEICKRTRRTFTAELTLMLEKYKPKQ